MSDKDIGGRVKLHEMKTLSDNHYILRRADFAWQRSDGQWQENQRESYDMGDGAAVLPVDPVRGTVLLVRQFRWPVFEWGHRQMLIEAIAGKLDGDDPATCVAREAMEEAGAVIRDPRLVAHCFMSPGAVTERLSLFLAEYDAGVPRAAGGGHESEGEDIEVLEVPLAEALRMAATGVICDAKTVMLLQALALQRAEAAR